MRAPEVPVPFVTVTALPLMSAFDFCLFTTIWDDPKEFEAGRFAADILASYWVRFQVYEAPSNWAYGMTEIEMG